MGSNEPITISILFLRHLIHNILLVVFRRQISRIWCRNILIYKLSVIRNGTKSLGGVELCTLCVPLRLLFSFSLKLESVWSTRNIITFLKQMLIFALTTDLLLSLLFSHSLLLHLFFKLHLVSLSCNWIWIKSSILFWLLIFCHVFIGGARARALSGSTYTLEATSSRLIRLTCLLSGRSHFAGSILFSAFTNLGFSTKFLGLDFKFLFKFLVEFILSTIN